MSSILFLERCLDSNPESYRGKLAPITLPLLF
jgi:hypothetical protein